MRNKVKIVLVVSLPAPFRGMAVGLPIISTNSGSIFEIITNGFYGFSIEPVDTYHICCFIIKLSSNQLIYDEISKYNINDIKNKRRIGLINEVVAQNYKSHINQNFKNK